LNNTLKLSLIKDKSRLSYFFKFYNCFLILIFIVSASIFFNVKSGVRNLQQDYKQQFKNVRARRVLVAELESAMEYGAFTHHFKNYVSLSKLGDQLQSEECILKVKSVLEKYRTLQLTEKEKKALQAIEAIVDQYKHHQSHTLHHEKKYQSRDNWFSADVASIIDAILSLKHIVNSFQEEIYLQEQQVMVELLEALSHLISIILPLLIFSGVVINYKLATKGKQLSQEVIVNKQLLIELNLNATAFDVSEAILITDANKRIIKVNKAFGLITGYAEHEVIGETPKILQSGKQDQEFYKEFWQSIKTHGSWSGEIIDRKKDGELFVAWSSVSQILDEQGNVEYYLSHFSDLTSFKNTQAAFARRIKVESVISEIAITFLESGYGSMNNTINDCLQLLGRVLAVDRSYLFSLSDDLAFMSNTHEWCEEGVEAMIDCLQDMDVTVFPWFVSQLLDNKVIRVDDVDKLPVEANNEYLEFQRQSIQSILVVPIADKGKVTGYFGFDRVKQKRNWRDEDVPLFQMIAKVFSLAQYQHKIEQENVNHLNKTIKLLAENTELLKKNRVLAVKTIQAQERERHYLAHELHDELGQLVTAIRMDVNFLQSLLGSKEDKTAIEMLGSIDDLSRQMISRLHSTIQRIRPETLDHLGLIPALNELVSDWKKHNHTVTVKTNFIKESKGLDENVTVTLYRAVQEALTNISKYAHADAIEISLEINLIKNWVQLTIVDNGVGFDSNNIEKEGVGLLAMEERVHALEGKFSILSGDDRQGTRIFIQLPIKNKAVILETR